MNTLPVYVINLKSDTERFENISILLKNAGMEFIRYNAIDGNNLPKETVDWYFDYNKSYKWAYNMTCPEIGCYLSHFDLWKIISESNRLGAFILEDDCLFECDAFMIFDSLSSINTIEPIIIKLYDPTPCSIRFNTSKLIKEYKLDIPYCVPWGCVAYYINKSAATKLIQNCAKFYMPVDDTLRHDWKTKVNTLVVSPPVVKLNEKYRENSFMAQQRHKSKEIYKKTIMHKIMIARRKIYYGIFNSFYNFKKLYCRNNIRNILVKFDLYSY